jgi:hypothetical protein
LARCSAYYTEVIVFTDCNCACEGQILNILRRHRILFIRQLPQLGFDSFLNPLSLIYLPVAYDFLLRLFTVHLLLLFHPTFHHGARHNELHTMVALSFFHCRPRNDNTGQDGGSDSHENSFLGTRLSKAGACNTLAPDSVSMRCPLLNQIRFFNLEEAFLWLLKGHCMGKVPESRRRKDRACRGNAALLVYFVYIASTEYMHELKIACDSAAERSGLDQREDQERAWYCLAHLSS